jgi:hypothetical protein
MLWAPVIFRKTTLRWFTGGFLFCKTIYQSADDSDSSRSDPDVAIAVMLSIEHFSQPDRKSVHHFYNVI